MNEKKERELQKEYNDGSIRILSNKTFTKGESLTRKDRRELVKDKNLLKELIKIINKYFPVLNKLLDNLTDKRHKSYIKYNIRKYMVKALIRSKMFDKYRYNGTFQLLVDATGISSHDYNLNNNCIIKKSKNGIIKYYKQVLEAKIVAGNIVISLDTEERISKIKIYNNWRCNCMQPHQC